MKANTRLQVLRGEEITSPLGDTEDINRIVLEGVPAFVRDLYSRRPTNSGSPSNNDAQCRVPFGTDVRVGDRVITHEGQTYVVRGRQRVRMANKDILLDLERISGNIA